MSLLDLALTDQNLLAAWQRVCSNNGAAGTDGITLDVFGANLMQRLAALRSQVKTGRYVTQPLLRITLPRPGKSPRLLGIPAIRDRVLQTAVVLVLTPLIDPHFADVSFGYRPGRSVAQAVQRVIDGRGQGFSWVVDADISSFFDTVTHEMLLAQLQPYLPDESLLPLIRQWLVASIKTTEGIIKRKLGLPQGAPISPLLANVYLHPLDLMLINNLDYWLVRYADDFVILARSLTDAERALEQSDHWLQAHGLELNQDKTNLVRFDQGFDFLGVHFERDTQWAIDPEAAPWVLPRHLQPQLIAPQFFLSRKSHQEAITNGRIPRAQQTSVNRNRKTNRKAERVELELPVEEELSQDQIAQEIADSQARLQPETDKIRMETDAPPLLRTLYLSESGVYLHRQGERIIVSRNSEELLAIPVEKLDQVFISSEGAISFGALRWLMRHRIVVLIADQTGEPQGTFRDETGGQIALHHQQWQRMNEPEFVLKAARTIVAAKIANSRLILRRYFRYRPDKNYSHDSYLAALQKAVTQASTLDAVRGHEGAAARAHFEGLRELLLPQWPFKGRNRRQPRDPVNALLSYGYGMLYHTFLNLILRRGLDPHSGSLHASRQGHAALASDLMEEFRPLVVDAVVLKLLLGGKAIATDFEYDHPTTRYALVTVCVNVLLPKSKLNLPALLPIRIQAKLSTIGELCFGKLLTGVML